MSNTTEWRCRYGLPSTAQSGGRVCAACTCFSFLCFACHLRSRVLDLSRLVGDRSHTISAKCQMENAKCEMGNGKWKMATGKKAPLCQIFLLANILAIMLPIANRQSPCKQRQQKLVNWVKCSAEIESKSKATRMGGEKGGGRGQTSRRNAINI